MGRQVRMVPADWEHPKAFNAYRGEDSFIPLYEGPYEPVAADWDAERAKWDAGERPSYCDASNYPPGYPYEEWAGERPKPDDYMPSWPDDQRTHFMMYETTTEGTPISPAFSTPEELARWLADNNASAFGGMTASYEGWLRVAKGGFAPSAMMVAGGPMVSGVEGLRDA